MNAGTWSGLVTAVLLALFIYGCFWAYSKNRIKDFDEAARLPLDDAPLEAEQRKGDRK